MTSYLLANAIRTETNIPGVGIVEHNFEAGVITPADAVEKAALERLAASGLATVTDGGKKKTTKPAEVSADDKPTEE